MRIGRREVRVTNLDKVFFPGPGLTKGDLIAYYVDVADSVLHHVRRRGAYVTHILGEMHGRERQACAGRPSLGR